MPDKSGCLHAYFFRRSVAGKKIAHPPERSSRQSSIAVEENLHENSEASRATTSPLRRPRPTAHPPSTRPPFPRENPRLLQPPPPTGAWQPTPGMLQAPAPPRPRPHEPTPSPHRTPVSGVVFWGGGAQYYARRFRVSVRGVGMRLYRCPFPARLSVVGHHTYACFSSTLEERQGGLLKTTPQRQHVEACKR